MSELATKERLELPEEGELYIDNLTGRAHKVERVFSGFSYSVVTHCRGRKERFPMGVFQEQFERIQL